MARQFTAIGAHVLMASAVLFLGLAGWSALGPAPAKPLHADAMAAPAEIPVTVVARARVAELPPLPVLQPMLPVETVAVNISVPATRQAAPPKQVVARALPRKPARPVPVAAQPALPKAPEPVLVRVAEAGSRA